MITIKLKVDNVRMLRKAKTPAELAGCVALILELVEQSETLKSFGKAPVVKRSAFSWKDAREVAGQVLGPDNVTIPPFPDGAWFRGLFYIISRDSLDEAAVRAIAEYCKDNLRMPVSLDFMLRQRERILRGEFNQKKAMSAPAAATWLKDTLPDE